VKFLIYIALFGFGLLSAAAAQDKSDKPVSKPKGEAAITAEREAAVMTFVEKNHAELKDLLTYLKDNRRKDYERAIRELSRDAERIGQIKTRDGKQYELEIKAWTIKSRIQLLTAHLAMGDKEEIRTQLRSLLNEQMDVRADLLKRERERAQERLAKIEQDLIRLDNDRQKMVENQLKMLTKSAADSKNKVKVTKNGPRPGNKKPVRPTVSQPDK
jgi:hypothetical protein